MLHATEAILPRSASLDGLKNIVADDMQGVNQVIIESISQEVKLIKDVSDHIIAAGGKRLRPSITIACAKLCDYCGDSHIKLAAAVELIHTATLLHDDVVDESGLRRGDKTANAVWSNQVSVLVGDFLISKAFQIMVKEKSLDVLAILSDASATISQGEVKQLLTAGEPETGFEAYIDVITSKTAALFAASSEIGAVLGKKGQGVRNSLYKFGESLGIAFQLVDDALDYSSSEEKLGKMIGDDFREGKITLPVIFAYQGGSEEEKKFWHRTMHDKDQNAEDLQTAISLINKHDAIKRTVDQARSYCSKAEAHISAFPDSKAKNALLDTLEFCVNRNF